MRAWSNLSSGAEVQCVVNDHMGPFTVFYVLLFVVGLPGNLFSAWAFVCGARVQVGPSHTGRPLVSRQQPHSASVYLLNLLVADLLLLLALPFKILKDLGAAPWGLMVFHCQASAVTIYISLYASVAFLALIITDRYLQDCHRLHSLRLREVGFARLLSVVVWLLLLLIMVPNMVLPIRHVQVQRYLSCSSLKKDLSLHWHSLTVFLCTALFVNASAAVLVSSALALKRLLGGSGDPKLRSDARRAAASVTAVAAAYVLSFVPYHVVRTPYTLAQAQVITDCGTKRQLFVAKESTLLLSVLHLCFDPLIFFYLWPPFREVTRKVVPCVRRQTDSDAEEMVQQAACARLEAAAEPQTSDELQQVETSTDSV